MRITFVLLRYRGITFGMAIAPNEFVRLTQGKKENKHTALLFQQLNIAFNECAQL